MNVNRLPSPGPSLLAQMRPPCASTIPLQMARPSPRSRPWSGPSGRENFANRWASRSAGTPRPLSATETATCDLSQTASTRTADPWWEWRAALLSRLLITWTMRRRSASTGGRSGGKSTRMFSRPPMPTKVLRASSTSRASTAGAGLTARVPVSILTMSMRSDSSSRMWSACSSMIRKNWDISAGSREDSPCNRVVADPLMAARGERSSWPTMPRNSARSRSSSASAVMSCTATTTDSTAPCAWSGSASR